MEFSISKKYHAMRNFLIILSLVNLCFLSVWRELIFSTKSDSYWIPTFPVESYAAAIFNVIGISVVIWSISPKIKKLSPKSWEYLRACGLLSALIFPANYFRKALNINSNFIYWLTSPEIIFPAIVLTLSLGWVIFYGLLNNRIIKFFSGVLIILFPFSLLTLSQASLKAIENLRENTLKPNATKMAILDKPAAKLQRVVWIIFDELDLRLAFINRPDNVNLPEFDQLRTQALFATQGLSHSKNTQEAIPSYLTGKLVASVQSISSSTLRLKYENSEEGQYSFLPGKENFFSDAYDLGARSAIIGMYHPYCRLFVDKVVFCSWYGLNTYTPQASNSFFVETFSQLTGILPVSGRINAISTYTGILESTLEVIGNSRFDVVYVHASVPHGPDIYLREADRLSLVNISRLGYFDNLVLADQFLGKLKHSMKAENLWDETTVLVTSDHEWRHVHLYDDVRVRKIPFLIKMAHQNEGVVYEKVFSPMLVTKDLLLQILSGNLGNIETVVNWLDHHSL